METFEPTPRECGAEDSKSSDPASADDRGKLAEGAPGSASDLLGPPAANRQRLQDERSAITHHFAFGGHEGYLTVGFYPNGQPGEIFIDDLALSQSTFIRHRRFLHLLSCDAADLWLLFSKGNCLDELN